MTRVDKQDAPLTLATMDEPIAWFCLRSQPRHEHIAARQLALMEDIEVFNPRIRFARPADAARSGLGHRIAFSQLPVCALRLARGP
jgi:hypothetical protein